MIKSHGHIIIGLLLISSYLTVHFEGNPSTYLADIPGKLFDIFTIIATIFRSVFSNIALRYCIGYIYLKEWRRHALEKKANLIKLISIHVHSN